MSNLSDKYCIRYQKTDGTNENNSIVLIANDSGEQVIIRTFDDIHCKDAKDMFIQAEYFKNKRIIRVPGFFAFIDGELTFKDVPYSRNNNKRINDTLQEMAHFLSETITDQSEYPIINELSRTRLPLSEEKIYKENCFKDSGSGKTILQIIIVIIILAIATILISGIFIKILLFIIVALAFIPEALKRK